MSSPWRGRVFRGATWALVASLYFLSPALMLVLGWFQEPFSELGHAETVSHRVHEVLFGALFCSALVGAVSQVLHKPRRAGALMALVAVGSFFVMLATLGRLEALGFLFVGLAAVMLATHPESGRWFRPNFWSLLLALTGVLPLLVIIEVNVGKAQAQAADHVTHWGGVAAWALGLGLLAIVAALRPSGYRTLEATVGLNGLAYAAASATFQFDASSGVGPLVFAVGVWSLVWLVKAFRPARMAPSPLFVKGLKAAGLAMVGVLGFLGTFDQAPNVPHGIEILAFHEIDRATCLDCHASGREGATLIPHVPSRICDEDCWGGRTDCVGCHRYDPILGGPTELAFGPGAPSFPLRRESLTLAQVASLSG